MTSATHVQTAQAQAGTGALAGFLRGVALLAGAPLLGLVFVIAVPVVGLAALLLMAGKALLERKAVVRIAFRHG